MHLLQLMIYVLCCLGVGYLGRGTRLGFWGISALAFFVTPILVFVVLLFLNKPFSAKGT